MKLINKISKIINQIFDSISYTLYENQSNIAPNETSWNR